jgi:2'-5' RNA ligase
MRLFLGFSAHSAERRIYDCCEALPLDPDLPLRWVPPENWHVTLAFLGEVTEQLLHSLAEAIEPVVAASRRMSLPLVGLEWFPSPSKARLLAMTAEAPEPLSALQRDLVAALGRAGFHTENRVYRPHLTLARYRGARKRFAPPELPLVKVIEMPLEAVTLFQSIPGKRAPVYQPLQDFGLAP